MTGLITDNGADNGIRTRDPHLGKVMLYQLSHVRVARRYNTHTLRTTQAFFSKSASVHCFSMSPSPLADLATLNAAPTATRQASRNPPDQPQSAGPTATVAVCLRARRASEPPACTPSQHGSRIRRTRCDPPAPTPFSGVFRKRDACEHSSHRDRFEVCVARTRAQL
jgi:hypothetical protein